MTLGNCDVGTARLGNCDIGTARLGNCDVGTARLGNCDVGTARLGNCDVGTARLGNCDVGTASLIPRPSHRPVFDCFQYAKKNPKHIICSAFTLPPFLQKWPPDLVHRYVHVSHYPPPFHAPLGQWWGCLYKIPYVCTCSSKLCVSFLSRSGMCGHQKNVLFAFPSFSFVFLPSSKNDALHWCTVSLYEQTQKGWWLPQQP